MRKSLAFLCMSLLLLCFLPLHFDQIEVKAPNGYPVHNLNTGLNYTSIQEAIDANETLAGHTIFVEQGTYYEHVVVNKSLSLIGENISTTIIDGNHTGDVIILAADYIRITGFTIQNGSPSVPPLRSGIFVVESIGNNISYNIIRNNAVGVCLTDSSHNVVSSNTVSHNVGGILLWNNSHNNTVVDNVVSSHNSSGISLYLSTNNEISGNNVSNGGGIVLTASNNNTISGNTAQNNTFGLSVGASSGNVFLKNNMTNNTYNFGMSGWFDSHFNNSVDTSNTVDGRPIYYLRNETGTVLDASTNAGTVYLINCSNIITKDLILTKNVYGVILIDTINSKIENVTVINNFHGISLAWSSNNFIYHNNFINNTQQVSINLPHLANSWDNGLEGNYWSDYNGTDINNDGIGDVAYEIDENNTDYYPLMGMFHSFNTSLGKHVNVISNSTIDDFEYCQPCNFIRMHVSNMTSEQTHGFCRISIPYEVMSEPFYVTINGVNPTYWNYTLFDNGTHRWIYFAYEHSTLEIIIVPEFPSLLILPLFMMATILAAIIYRRKRKCILA